MSTITAPDGANQRESTPSSDEFVGRWRIHKTIGQGTYGKVRLGVDPLTGEKVAVKVIEKAQVQSAKQIARLQREIRFLRLLHHPHIVQVFDVNETEHFIYIVMEYASGGELFDYIVAHKRVKEKEARSFFRQVLSAVDYCHKNAVIHRDLKPENLLLDETKTIKIIDFGFGNNFTSEGLLDTFCGSPFYAAPEMILGKKYEGPEVDMWSLGVILFALLCGHLPFDDDNMKELYRKIASGSYTCPDYLLPSARHLIGRLITVDPKKRATLDEVFLHPWINEGFDAPPPNYLPDRPIVSDINHLSKEILHRLYVFGYAEEDVQKAFAPGADQSKPSPVRATYFLLKEMLAREEAKTRVDRRKSIATAGNSAYRGPSVLSRPSVRTASLSNVEERTSFVGRPHKPEHSMARLSPAARKDHFASLQALSTILKERRASTPESGSLPRKFSKRGSKASDSPSESLPRRSTAHAQGSSPAASSIIDEPKMPEAARTSITLPKDRSSHAHQWNHHSHPRPATAAAAAAPPPPSLPLPPTPSHTVDTDTHKDWTRRFSVPSAKLSQTLLPTDSPSSRASIAGSHAVSPSKLRTDLRAVSGWFFNVSTTSTKNPGEILGQLQDVLTSCQVKYTVEARLNDPNPESPITLTCDVDPTDMMMTSEQPTGIPPPSPPADGGQQLRQDPHQVMPNIGFQITIYKVPRLALSGVHFKRLHGGVWNYKKVCNKLMGQLNL